MAHRRAPARAGMTIGGHQDAAALVDKNGRPTSGVEADEATPQASLSPGAKAALGAIGAWADIDWDETLAELERIRREGTSSPPIEDL